MSSEFPELFELIDLINKLFPENSSNDSSIAAGFVLVYSTASPNVKSFLREVMRGGLAEAREINRYELQKIAEEIERLKKSKEKIQN